VKILLLLANPRKDGYTQNCVNLFLNGMNDAGADVDVVDLTSTNIKSCRGCFHCWSNPGVCIQKDGQSQLLEKFLSSEMLVVATPNYAFGVSSYLKIFQERTLPLLTPGVCRSPLGHDANSLRYPDRGPKKMAALIVGGLKDSDHMSGVKKSLELYADGFQMEFCGALTRSESFLLQFAESKPKTISKIDNALTRAGRMLVLEGKISDDLFEKVATPLAPDLDTFQRYSNVYWEWALQFPINQSGLELIRNKTNYDLRILMFEMARYVDPVATRGLDLTIQFECSEPDQCYCIRICDGKSIITEQKAEHFDLLVKCKSHTWAGIIRREIDPVKPLHSGEIVLEGDSSLFRKMGRFFPPPKM
jgi:multimeric flavodoxin WrbA